LFWSSTCCCSMWVVFGAWLVKKHSYT
jgi:hypothetical protein